MTRATSVAGRIVLWIAAIAVTALVVCLIAARLRETDGTRPAELVVVATRTADVTVAIAGPRDGPPLMIVPGTAGWSGFWRDVTAHLARRGYRVIAVDLPPFGYSDHPPDMRYDRAAQATRLADVLQSLSPVRRAVVLAHSFGAGSATELALTSPDRVARLVLVDAALGTIDPPIGRTLFERALSLKGVSQPAIATTLVNPRVLPMLMRSMVARKSAPDAWLETVAAPMRRPGTTSAYAAWAPTLVTADDGAISRRSAALSAIRVPVALIWGAEDSVTPPDQGRRLATLMHAPPPIFLPGVGHVPHIEDPAAFLTALDATLPSAGAAPGFVAGGNNAAF